MFFIPNIFFVFETLTMKLKEDKMINNKERQNDTL